MQSSETHDAYGLDILEYLLMPMLLSLLMRKLSCTRYESLSWLGSSRTEVINIIGADPKVDHLMHFKLADHGNAPMDGTSFQRITNILSNTGPKQTALYIKCTWRIPPR